LCYWDALNYYWLPFGPTSITIYGQQLEIKNDPGFEYDVNKRVPSVQKARDILGFDAKTSLSEMLDEVIPWIRRAIQDGTI
jgi:nucleoside-diphosphate-sugar epimerase